MTEHTDAAREIVDLVEDLRRIGRTGTVAFTALANHWEVDENSTDFLELLGVVSSRVHNFKMFVESVDDPFVSRRVRAQVLSSVVAIAGAFSPARLAGPWVAIHENNLSEKFLGDVELFSSIASKHQLLRRLSEDERVDLVQRISHLIEQLSDDAELDGWIRQLLVDGLVRARYALVYIRVFGHDKAIDEIAYTFQRFDSLYKTAEKTGRDSEDKSKIFTALNVLMLAANLFCVSDQTLTAFDRYKGWLIAPVAQAQLAPPETQRLLPPPGAPASAEIEPTDV